MTLSSAHSPEDGRDRLQAIVDGALDGLITIDRRGIIETFNPACERIFGYEAVEVIGRDVNLLMMGPNAQLIDAAEREVSGRRKDGSIFPIGLSISRFELEDGLHYCGIIRDITERRHAEAQRQQLVEKLMLSNTELERFAYVASHDMQEPVRMVVSFSKIVAQDYGDRLDDKGREFLKFITDSGERIHNMIEDLLNYARIGNEGSSLVPVDGALELHHVLANLGELIKESGAQITSDVLPVFKGNPVQFMRLMQNLIANAVKYQEPGSVPRVHIGVEDAGAAWRISVKDNGIGVDPAFAQKIFEPFRRLHRWEQIKGSGLGLAVCKKIVENHGGDIVMSSVPGQGSTFFVTLPKNLAESA